MRGSRRFLAFPPLFGGGSEAAGAVGRWRAVSPVRRLGPGYVRRSCDAGREGSVVPDRSGMSARDEPRPPSTANCLLAQWPGSLGWLFSVRSVERRGGGLRRPVRPGRPASGPFEIHVDKRVKCGNIFPAARKDGAAPTRPGGRLRAVRSAFPGPSGR